MSGLVDVHHHVLPPFYMDAIRAAGHDRNGLIRFPEWEPGDSLAMMDRQGIATAVVSVSVPGVAFAWPPGERRALARACNEWMAELVNAHSGRFGAFACLPLPDVDGAIDEVGRALDVLALDGVTLFASAGDRYLGHQRFEPLIAELARRQAVAFLHPTAPPGAPLPGLDLPVSTVEFVADTTRAIANLILSGTLERHRGVRFVCAHAGGFAPYISDRLETAWRGLPGASRRAPAGPTGYLRSLSYDTAASANPFTLAALLALTGPARVLFGSDFPFLDEAAIAQGMEVLASFPGLEEGDRALVGGGNARGLLPGLDPKGS